MGRGRASELILNDDALGRIIIVPTGFGRGLAYHYPFVHKSTRFFPFLQHKSSCTGH